MKLSPQKEQIVSVLRDKEWHCSSEFGYIKDDRKRISELNEGYMREKGYEIIGKPCDGRCGKKHSSGLFMRKAVKLGLGSLALQELDKIDLYKIKTDDMHKKALAWFERI